MSEKDEYILEEYRGATPIPKTMIVKRTSVEPDVTRGQTPVPKVKKVAAPTDPPAEKD